MIFLNFLKSAVGRWHLTEAENEPLSKTKQENGIFWCSKKYPLTLAC